MSSWMHFAPGVRLANRNALVRIKNITTEANKKLTWDLMQDAYQKCVDELGILPTHIFMSGRSRRQLRDLSITPKTRIRRSRRISRESPSCNLIRSPIRSRSNRSRQPQEKATRKS